ncbi:hypothetical protein QMZ92_11285 [Streptomyces sp. HNM0645]|uniref:hypothetical protein n=1 Tax=Streptomyces sp. HNM0645 TaxID=2782343 RepID=UPI0024B704B1|nr:hypothetical protein [Streptomyces sp. HNM0645]MDI9884958.1 hypothetical protein [Streptomyces sp. HNM0645]
MLTTALKSGKLEYVMVKANENTGRYAGNVMQHFDIDLRGGANGADRTAPQLSDCSRGGRCGLSP